MNQKPAESGYVTLELVLGLAVLVLPVLLLVLALPTWFDRQDLARLAAQQAARTAVISESLPAGAAAGDQVGAQGGLTASDLSVGFDPASSLNRGATVIAVATVRVPALAIPGLGTVGHFSLTQRYTEPVDRYRSGP